MHANVQKIQFGGTYNPAQVSVFNTVGIRNTLLFLLYCTVQYGFPPDVTFCWGLVQVFSGEHSEFCECAHSPPTFISPKLTPSHNTTSFSDSTSMSIHLQFLPLQWQSSFKSRMREKWENWMVTGGGIENGVTKESTRQLVAEWAVEVYKNLPAQTVRNAWMKSGFEWF